MKLAPSAAVVISTLVLSACGGSSEQKYDASKSPTENAKQGCLLIGEDTSNEQSKCGDEAKRFCSEIISTLVELDKLSGGDMTDSNRAKSRCATLPR